MTRENLETLTRQIRQALEFPQRLMKLKAEISDHLALAYQERGDFRQAAELFVSPRKPMRTFPNATTPLLF
jgi:hypothetical protein